MAAILRATTLLAVLSATFAGVGAAQTSGSPATRTAHFQVQVFSESDGEFTARVDDYFELRRRLQAGLPALIVTDDVRQLRRNTRSLARAIRAARSGALQGEFFNTAASAEFRRVFAVIMNATVWAVIMDGNPGSFGHDIDGSYPAGKSHATMPGIILARLPPLPEDIEFRFVGVHLILYDVRSNTIIDQLPDAIRCAAGCSP